MLLAFIGIVVPACGWWTGAAWRSIVRKALVMYASIDSGAELVGYPSAVQDFRRHHGVGRRRTTEGAFDRGVRRKGNADGAFGERIRAACSSGAPLYTPSYATLPPGDGSWRGWRRPWASDMGEPRGSALAPDGL